jgi:hypothetical protein
VLQHSVDCWLEFNKVRWVWKDASWKGVPLCVSLRKKVGLIVSSAIARNFQGEFVVRVCRPEWSHVLLQRGNWVMKSWKAQTILVVVEKRQNGEISTVGEVRVSDLVLDQSSCTLHLDSVKENRPWGCWLRPQMATVFQNKANLSFIDTQNWFVS